MILKFVPKWQESDIENEELREIIGKEFKISNTEAYDDWKAIWDFLFKFNDVGLQVVGDFEMDVLIFYPDPKDHHKRVDVTLRKYWKEGLSIINHNSGELILTRIKY